MSELVVEEDREAWETHRREALAGSAPRGLEFRIRRGDGQIRWIEHLCTKVSGERGDVSRGPRVEPGHLSAKAG